MRIPNIPGIMSCTSHYVHVSSVWEYDTENHTEKSNHTETPLKPHWEALQKITLKFLLYHTEIWQLLLFKNVNPL